MVGRQCTPHGDPTNQLPCVLWVYSNIESHTFQNPWSMFQDGSNGEPTGQHPKCANVESHWMHALPATIEETAFHERTRSSGFGLRQYILVHILSRMTNRLISVPHPTGAYRGLPSASLMIISSTL
ncbi:hypothetical protein CQW23_31637 [Capsicum baccatum]|uniref:Uncharacterized protein n=1 Tax=Capsicum baccatum TaxID=33114 RepID=A0A2G2V704_CAPBA|nr:hypothetical protein CQW23_31637 [Capsicum baccatum]